MRPRGGVLRLLPWLAPAMLLWGVAVYSLMPDGIIPYDDDFGYVRSVVHTIQHGRPWTDDWLEPWAASLSAIAAVVYEATGSFTFAVQGVAVVFASLAVVPVMELFARRGVSRPFAVMTALVLLSFPVLVWKQVQFTSMVVYVPMLFLALLCAEQRRWILFFVAFAVALTSRQSAVAWLVLPLWVGLRESFSRSEVPLWRRAFAPAVVVAAGLGLYGCVGLWMNQTYAQRVMTSAMWRGADLPVLVRGLVLSVSVFATAAGIGGLVLRLLAGGGGGQDSRTGRWTRSAIGLVALAGPWLTPYLSQVELELPLREASSAGHYMSWLVALAAVGWIAGGWRLRPDFAVAGAAAGVLVSLRGSVWDYYLLDVAALAFFAVQPIGEEGRSPPRGWRRIAAFSAGAAMIAVIGWQHVTIALRTKRVIDGTRALTLLCEHAMRGGRIGPDSLSIAPFGHQGWHLYPHFTRTIGKDGRYIADFTRFLRPNSLVLEVRGAATGAPEFIEVSPEGTAIASGVFRVLWRERHEFVLRLADPVAAAEVSLDRSEYTWVPYPLNDEEWGALIEAGSALSGTDR